MSWSSKFTTGMCALLMISAAALAQEGEGRRKGRGMLADNNALKVGQNAPLFTLKSLDGKQETDLKSFRGGKPVILFFGSYT